LGGKGVNEIERIEDLLHESDARIGRRAHAQASAFDLLDDVEGHGPRGQIKCGSSRNSPSFVNAPSVIRAST
jgi:hypothetical protein